MATASNSSGNSDDSGLAAVSRPDETTSHKSDAETILHNWRTKILNGFLIIVAVASAVGTAVSIRDALSHPDQWPAAILFSALEVVLIVLAVFPRIDYRARAWGVLLVPYVVGVSNLASFGLGSSGRMFLLAVPIGGLILIGVRSGIIMSVLVALTMAVFTILSNLGLLQQWLVTDRNSLLLSDWIAESTDTWLLLLTIMALLIMFYRFQESLIRKTHRAQAELLQTQKLLEEQNTTLEQKVRERTSELQASNHSLEQRNAALAIINSVQEELASKLDLQAIYELIGEKVCEVFRVQVMDIVTYDPDSNLISMPFSYEKGDRSVISPTEPYGFRLHVINSCKPLLINRGFVELASQYKIRL